MKKHLIIVLLFSFQFLNAQKGCEYSTNVTDSIGTYKSTKSNLMHQRNFGGNEKSIYFSLINSDGLKSLNVQIIQKSNDFSPASCFDERSRVYFQLSSGKIVTLLSVNDSNCGSSLVLENKNCRVLNGYFIFLEGTIEELKKDPITLMRINYATEIVDYVVKDELVSELDKSTQKPSTYFIDYLPCID
jgi:hypothetical protein